MVNIILIVILNISMFLSTFIQIWLVDKVVKHNTKEFIVSDTLLSYL
jgi:hypothetical protein